MFTDSKIFDDDMSALEPESDGAQPDADLISSSDHDQANEGSMNTFTDGFIAALDLVREYRRIQIAHWNKQCGGEDRRRDWSPECRADVESIEEVLARLEQKKGRLIKECQDG